MRRYYKRIMKFELLDWCLATIVALLLLYIVSVLLAVATGLIQALFASVMYVAFHIGVPIVFVVLVMRGLQYFKSVVSN